MEVETNYNLLVNAETQNVKLKEYVPKEAKIVAKLITSINKNVTRTGVTGEKLYLDSNMLSKKV